MKRLYAMLLVCLLPAILIADGWVDNENNIYSRSNGVVGIGTTNPSAGLEIVYPDCVSRFTHTEGEGLLIRRSSIGSNNDSLITTIGANESLHFAAGNWTNIPAMTLTTDGRLGVGTTNSSAGIEIVYPDCVGRFTHTEGEGLLIRKSSIASSNDALITTVGVNESLHFAAGNWTNNPAMTLLPSGNLGIGTTNPAHKLTVEGTIAAREVKVTTEQWSDFVFDDDYELRSLAAVAAYIAKNNHLPDVPSGAEIEQGGIAVSEMLAKQMQKIEELTLYVIELKQENDSLKAENKDHAANSAAALDAVKAFEARLAVIESQL